MWSTGMGGALRLAAVLPWLKYDDRGLAWASRRICVEVAVDGSPARPQPLPFGSFCPVGMNRPDAVAGLHRDVWVGLHVQPPLVRTGPAVHRHGDQGVTVLDVADYHHPGATGASADAGEAERTPTATPRSPEAETPTGVEGERRAVRRGSSLREKRWRWRTDGSGPVCVGGCQWCLVEGWLKHYR